MAGSAILIGVDDSDAGAAVVARAVGLAQRLGLRAVLAHATEDASSFPDGDQLRYERRRRERIARGAELLERLAGGAAAVAERRVVIGAPATALERLAGQLDAALVAVGSHGRGLLQAALVGSVSRTLATRGGRPVLVVPPAAAGGESGLDRLEPAVVCGVDGSAHADAALRAAAALARAGGLRLVLTHVLPEPLPAAALPRPGLAAPVYHHAELMERQREAGTLVLEQAGRLLDGDVEASARLETGAVAERLELVARDEAAALIAVGARGQGAVRAALLGSTSAELAATAARPVLVVPPGARLVLEPLRAGDGASASSR